MSVVIETTIGDITVDLYLKERPNACLNFLKLCKIKYYNLCVFHKVERNFIAQTGDPTSTGRGGESVFASLYGDQAKYFEAEIKPRLKHEKLGTLSMVNNGNNMNGSQFFITLAENLTYLDEVHTVFGEVAEGFEILLKLNEAICDPNNRPFQDIRITHTVVLHDPYDDPPGLEIPDASPEPTKEMLETDYIAADEEIDDTKGKNVEEIEEKIKDSEAKARATILEMVGDIPDADVKPPEDVLFVCKLNPVTTSEDLELIFSRFGPIVSCEVIKDKKSGESLQYAFIEFEKEEDCENAYFKMDNVLIDDRRIHVDFSQSVSKLNWDMENKSSRDKSNKQQNLVFKDKEKKSDGYEMIFDIDTDSKHSKSDHKEQYQSKLSSTKEHHSHKSHDRHRSPDSPPRRSHSDNYHTSKQSSKSKDSSNYSRSRQKFSRSPSYLKSRSFRRSRSPSRSHFSKTSSQQLNRKYTYHDSRSSSASSYEQKPTSYKRKHHSPQHHHKRTMIKPSHSTDREKDENPSYYESSRSHSSIYSKHKYSSRKRSKSPHKKRSRTPVSSPSHSVPPKRYGSEKTSYSTEFIKHSKKSSRNSSKSTSPQYRKYQKKVSSNSKHVSLKNSKEYKKSKINSDSSDSPQYSESQKKVSSKYGSLKNSKEHKKHKKSKSDSDSSESSDDSRTDVNRTEIKSKSISSHTEYSKHKYSHKTKHHKHSSR